MSKKVGGINIPIQAEDTEFKKSMRDVNKELLSSHKLAKEYQKSLEFDPSDVKQLEKAFDEVNKSVEASNKKTEILQEELDRLSKQDILVTQEIEKLSKELEASYKDSEKLSKELKELEKIDAPIEEFQKLQKELEKSEENSKKLSDELEKLEKVKVPDEKFKSLQTQIEKSENNTRRLNQEVTKLDDHLRAINTGNVNDLSKYTQSASKYMSQLANESKEASKEVNSISSKALDDLNDATVGSVKSMGAFGVATAAAAVTVGRMAMESEDAATFMRSYGASVQSAEISTEEAYETTALFAKTLGLDMAEATEVATGAMKLFGDSINSTNGMMAAMTATYGILQSNTLSVEEAQSIYNAALDQFNTSQIQAIGLIGDSVALFQEYGKEADDIADTFREWSDTFVALGFTASEFFTILEQGLILGAKNTDEVANAFNEMYLRISEGSEETVAALDAIGLSLTDMQELIDTENGQQAFAEIVLAMNEAELAAEDLMTVGAALFGTMGEEWIVPLVENEAAMTSLSNAMMLTSNRATATAEAFGFLELAGKSTEEQIALLSDFLVANSEQLGITAVQAKNLAQGFVLGGLSSLTMAQAGVILQAALIGNKEAIEAAGGAAGFMTQEIEKLSANMGLSIEQSSLLTQAFKNLKASEDENAQGMLVFLALLVLFTNRGLITTDTAVAMKDAFVDFYNNGLIPSSESLSQLNSNLQETIEQQGLTEQETKRLKDTLVGFKETLEDGSFTTHEFNQAVRAMSDALGISDTSSEELVKSLITMGNSSATASQQVSAMQTILAILHDAQVISNDAFEKGTEKVQKYSNMMKTGAAESDKMSQELMSAGKEANVSGEHIEDFTNAVEESLKPIDKLRAELEKLDDDFRDVSSSASSAASSVNSFSYSSPSGMSAMMPSRSAFSLGPKSSASKSGRTSNPSVQGHLNIEEINIIVPKLDVSTVKKDVVPVVSEELRRSWGRLLR